MSVSCVSVAFSDLTAEQVHDVARLRQDVFVVEQHCPYADLDGRDVEQATRHVLLTDGGLIGYARILDDEPVWRIGRVLLHPRARGQGLAEIVMHTALAVARGRDVVLDAQSPLADWYATHGFEVSGPGFLEDGIPHVPMRRRS